jgi:hypothetical protein
MNWIIIIIQFWNYRDSSPNCITSARFLWSLGLYNRSINLNLAVFPWWISIFLARFTCRTQRRNQHFSVSWRPRLVYWLYQILPLKVKKKKILDSSVYLDLTSITVHKMRFKQLYLATVRRKSPERFALSKPCLFVKQALCNMAL